MFPFDDVIMQSPTTHMFIHQFVQAYKDDNIKASHNWLNEDRTHQWPVDSYVNRQDRERTESTLAQVTACCLTAPSHYLNQRCLIISEVQWLSSEGNSMNDTLVINHKNSLQIIWNLKFNSNLAGANKLSNGTHQYNLIGLFSLTCKNGKYSVINTKRYSM